MKKLVIFGSGCHAKVVLSEALKLKKFKLLGFVDDYEKKGKLVLKIKNKKYYNIGKIKNLKSKKNIYGIIGVGSSALRKKIYIEIITQLKKFKFEKIISKNTIIDQSVKLGEGTVVISNSIINRGTTVGNHCLINTSSSIDHDNIIDNFASISPGVTTGGRVKIGEKTFIGIGSTIKNSIKIGKNVLVGGASFVNKNLKDNSLVYGVPAKKIKKIK